MPLLPRESAKEIFTLVTDRVLNDMRCFRGELTLGVHKIPFLEFSPEMAEQLVGAVDQVDLHRSERYHFAALVFSAEQPRANAVSWHPAIISICNAMPHVLSASASDLCPGASHSRVTSAARFSIRNPRNTGWRS
jgi:hypothetical protein